MKLLFLGDSLIEWGDWPTLLPEYEIINRGKAGETVESLSVRLGRELDRFPDPDLVLLMSGTNNLLAADTLFPVILRSMLPRLCAISPAGTPVLVNAILPMRQINRKLLQSINRDLESTATQSGCFFLDPGPAFTVHCLPITHPCFHTDGVHLSTRGYAAWADTLRNRIQSLFNAP